MEPKRVKVVFRLEKDDDGYPPVEVESLWGIERRDGIELDNVPFYARGIALGDVVAVQRAQDGALEFASVVRRGGHSTYRVLLKGADESDPQRTIEELIQQGLGVESDVPCLLAIDAPPETDINRVVAYLLEGAHAGRWEVEEGYRAVR